jgi:6-pyruvoyltetrahydropterin/6-carboxytetrahydropterin synthase
LVIFQVFEVNAAHYLPCLPETHPCRRLHGHTFRIEVHIEAPLDPAKAWVRDFAEVREAFAPLHEALDHGLLNDVEGLENPTSENLARWIWTRLKDSLPELSRVVVQETANAGAIYEGID